MPTAPLASSSRQRPYAAPDSPRSGSGHEPVSAAASVTASVAASVAVDLGATDVARNASRASTSSATVVMVRPDVKPILIRAQSVEREYQKTVSSLQRFHRYADEAYKNNAVFTEVLTERLNEYHCAVDAMVAYIAIDPNGSDMLRQRHALRRLSEATYLLKMALSVCKTLGRPASLIEMLSTAFSFRSCPLEDVQKHLGEFENWVGKHITPLPKQGDDARSLDSSDDSYDWSAFDKVYKEIDDLEHCLKENATRRSDDDHALSVATISGTSVDPAVATTSV